MIPWAVSPGLGPIIGIAVILGLGWMLDEILHHVRANQQKPKPPVTQKSLPRAPRGPGIGTTFDPRWRPAAVDRVPDAPATPPIAHCHSAPPMTRAFFAQVLENHQELFAQAIRDQMRKDTQHCPGCTCPEVPVVKKPPTA